MPSVSQMKRSRLAPIALTAALSVTLLTFSSASNAAVGTTLTEGMELNLFSETRGWQTPATPFGVKFMARLLVAGP